MMSEPVTFQWLEISNFRGFGESQRFDLDASAVLVTGPNGSGKTSFFDALQWLILGTLDRLANLRVRKNDDFLGNLFQKEAAPLVAAGLSVGGEMFNVSRTRRGDDCPLTLTDSTGLLAGETAQRRLDELLAGSSSSGTSLAMLLKSSALLQQDANRSVLLESPSDRYTILAGLLGLDEVAAFGTETKAREKRLLDATKELRSRYNRARARLEADRHELRRLENESRPEPEAADVASRVDTRLRTVEDTVSVPREVTSGSDAALVQESASALGTQLSRLLVDWTGVQSQRAVVSPELLRAAERLRADREDTGREWTQLRESLAQAEVQLTTAREKSSQVELLAALAIDMLGPTCPVCAQQIDESDVHAKLAERVSNAVSGDVERLTAAASELRAGCEAKSSRLRAIDARIDLLEADVARATAFNNAVKSWHDAAASVSAPDDGRLTLHELDAIRTGDTGAIQRTRDALRTVWASASDLLAVYRVGRDAQAVSRLRNSLVSQTADVDRLEAEVGLASQSAESSTTLRKAATAALAEVTKLRFQQAAPLVRNIYDRIAPHRAFKFLDIDFDVHYGKGIASAFAVDRELGVQADPLLHFSSAQTNVTALSYFLALGWAAGDASLPFLMMDDPVQAMDDINVLGFADLCRYVRRDRQLLLSTHDQRFAALVERKLTPRSEHQSTIVLEFGAWTARGPQVTQRRLEPQLAEGRLRLIGKGKAA